MEKVSYFVDIYDPRKDEILLSPDSIIIGKHYDLRNKDDNHLYHNAASYKSYIIDDSLHYYLCKLNTTDLNSTQVKWDMGRLLEKKYLYLRSTSKNKKSFNIYNVSLWAYKRKSSLMALNILFNNVGEFVCIDSIILETDKMKLNKNDNNHLECLKLVNNNETGNCIW